MLAHERGDALPHRASELLGIVEQRHPQVVRENDGARRDRPRQCPAPHLIDAGDHAEAPVVQHTLHLGERVEALEFGTLAFEAGRHAVSEVAHSCARVARQPPRQRGEFGVIARLDQRSDVVDAEIGRSRHARGPLPVADGNAPVTVTR